MSPELKAFRFYNKNIDYFLNEINNFWGDNDKLINMYRGIAEKFGADYNKLMMIHQISYKRYVNRACK